jgi:hypothetical protein
LVCGFLAGCIVKGTAAAGGLAVLGAQHDRGVTEKIKENLIDVKFDVRILDSNRVE